LILATPSKKPFPRRLPSSSTIVLSTNTSIPKIVISHHSLQNPSNRDRHSRIPDRNPTYIPSQNQNHALLHSDSSRSLRAGLRTRRLSRRLRQQPRDNLDHDQNRPARRRDRDSNPQHLCAHDFFCRGNNDSRTVHDRCAAARHGFHGRLPAVQWHFDGSGNRRKPFQRQLSHWRLPGVWC